MVYLRAIAGKSPIFNNFFPLLLEPGEHCLAGTGNQSDIESSHAQVIPGGPQVLMSHSAATPGSSLPLLADPWRA